MRMALRRCHPKSEPALVRHARLWQPRPRAPLPAQAAQAAPHCAQSQIEPEATLASSKRLFEETSMNREFLDASSIETRLIHRDRCLNATSAVVPPIFQTANFRGDS